MSIDVILELQVNPENREELLSFFTALLPEARAYKGCQSMVVTSDEDDIHNIVLLQKWDQRSDQESYMAWRTERGDVDKIASLLSSPPTLQYLTPIPI